MGAQLGGRSTALTPFRWTAILERGELIVCRIPDLVRSRHPIVDLGAIAVGSFMMDLLAPLLDPIKRPRAGSIIQTFFGDVSSK